MDVHASDQPALYAAASIARRLREAMRRRGAASLAVSGGSTAPALLDALAAERIEWARVTTWQVDERIAPDGDRARNALQLAGLPGNVRLMPVTAADVVAAAADYAGSLPDRFDVIHLGLGDDGHTASWPPGDAAVLTSTRAVDVVAEFNGYRRMTLTPRVVNAAHWRVVLAVGAGKRDVATRWLLEDESLPIASLKRAGTTAFFDLAAAPGV